MLKIFGKHGRITNAEIPEVLTSCCPACGYDLTLKELKTWFMLFFVPVVPVSTIDKFYQCDRCKSSYKVESKSAILHNKTAGKELEVKAKKIFSEALAASMIHMALVDGDYAYEERKYIEDTLNKLTDSREEAFKILEGIEHAANRERATYTLLREATKVLTSEAVMVLISSAAQVLLADGKIERTEEQLLKEYLTVCGLPKSMYPMIIDKLNQQEQETTLV